MNIRDEFHHVSDNAHRLGVLGMQDVDRMIDEIDRLCRWKEEAVEVLKRWDLVAERFDLSGHLGEFTADAVGAEIDQMRETIAFLRQAQ